MKVSNIQLEERNDVVELSAYVGEFRLWYQFPAGTHVSCRGDGFLAAAMLPAMTLGGSLEIDPSSPVSKKLLANCATIQDIFRHWYPVLRPVTIHCEADEGGTSNGQVGSFFSGGADGIYSFLKHEEEITQLFFVRGIDMQLNNDTTFKEACAQNAAYLNSHRKPYFSITSNIRFLFHHFKPLSWASAGNGPGLASVALALDLKRTYIASTHAYDELFPWGSHPLIDPLFSTETNEIVHDGAEARRSDKLRRISQDADAMKILRVCWQDKGYNCGHCEKCLRTRVGLRALGVTTPTLPPLESLREVSRLPIYDDSELSFVHDNLKLAKAMGDKELYRALAKCLRKYEVRKSIKQLDRLFFGGLLHRLRRRGNCEKGPATSPPA